MQRISIIGLGLIGSSVGLGLRRGPDGGKPGASLTVSGYDVEASHQDFAREINAIDRAEPNFASAVTGADLIVVATPVQTVLEVFRTIAEHGKPNVIVTDTCSTKAAVMNWASEILPDWVHFIGGHPMAGKTESVEGADADLFTNAIWCLSPRPQTAAEGLQTVLGVVEQLGAEPLLIDPSEHDSYVAGISHLPFLLSIALTRAADRHPARRDLQRLSAGGFRDASRLALGSPRMYRDICATNSDNIVRWMDATIDELQHLRRLIDSGTDETLDWLQTEFAEARASRSQWLVPEDRRGTTTHQGQADSSVATVGRQVRQLLLGQTLNELLNPGNEQEDRTGHGAAPRRNQD
jgi:prephenate dehydrogenase